jgi:hypothetical protein
LLLTRKSPLVQSACTCESVWKRIWHVEMFQLSCQILNTCSLHIVEDAAAWRCSKAVRINANGIIALTPSGLRPSKFAFLNVFFEVYALLEMKISLSWVACQAEIHQNSPAKRYKRLAKFQATTDDRYSPFWQQVSLESCTGPLGEEARATLSRAHRVHPPCGSPQPLPRQPHKAS